MSETEKYRDKFYTELESYLSKIDYSLRHVGCDYHVIKDHEHRETGIILTGESLEFKPHKENFGIYFFIKHLRIQLLDNNCVTIYCKNNKSVFINLYNHTRKYQ